MKKLLLFASLGLAVVASLTACDKYVSENNPYNLVANKQVFKECIYYKDLSVIYENYDMPFRNLIQEIHTFKNVSENKASESANSFVYRIYVHSVLVNNIYRMVFYSDGYVDVDRTSQSSEKDHYYYRFDVEKAKKLFDFTEYVYQTKMGNQIE